jgi:hypothetical protein
MRKALIGLILAATAVTPVAANAQNWHDRGESRSDRGETHAARAEQRQERQAERAQQQAPQRQAPQAQVVDRQRGDGGNRGNWQARADGNARANWQGRTDANARGNGQVQADANARGNWQGRADGNGRGNWQGRDRANQGSIYPQAWQGDPNDPRLRHYQQLERQNQQRYNNDRRDWRGDNRNNRADWRGDNNRGRRNWDRNWRNDNRYDWQRYRYSNRDIFHIGPYYSPYRDYGYNRFSIGLFLDPFFYDQRYWLPDPWEFRLPPAEPGTEWVRYYNDVLLVDVYTGEVLDAIYDFFW